jgi:hypothetical protein
VTPLSKRDAPAAPRVVHEWPDELMTGVGHDPYLEEVRSVALWFSRSFHARLLDSWDEAGVYGVAHCFYKSLLRIWQRGINGLRRMRARGQR